MAQPKKKQLEITGTGTDLVPDIEELAAPYTEKLYARQELQDEENALREQLGERMEALGIERYVYRDGESRFIITRNAVMKVKVKREKDAEPAPANA